MQAEQVQAAIPQYQERFVSIVEKAVSIVGTQHASMVKEKLGGIDLSGIAFTAVDQASGFLGGLVLVVLYVAFIISGKSSDIALTPDLPG